MGKIGGAFKAVASVGAADRRVVRMTAEFVAS